MSDNKTCADCGRQELTASGDDTRVSAVCWERGGAVCVRVQRDAARARVAEVERERDDARANEDEAIELARREIQRREVDAELLTSTIRIKDEIATERDEARARVAEVERERDDYRHKMKNVYGDIDQPPDFPDSCNYCHGFGACPVCWGRAAIVNLGRDRDANFAHIAAVQDREDEARAQLAAVQEREGRMREALEAWGRWQAQEGRALASDSWQDNQEARERRDEFVRLYEAALTPPAGKGDGQ